MYRSSFSFVAPLAIIALAGHPLAAKLETGDKAPNFTAKGTDGNQYSLKDSKGANATVLCFTCNQCPVATAYQERFIEFAGKYRGKGVEFIALNVNYNEDLEAMKRHAEQYDFPYPYAYDGSGESAKAYGAEKTPHLFVLDGQGKVMYQGAFDNSSTSPTEHFVVDAVEAVLAGEVPEVTRTSAVGCAIRLAR